MKTNTDTTVTDTIMTDGLDSEPDDGDAYRRDQTFLPADDEMADPGMHPALRNISAGMVYAAVLRAEHPDPAEYVTIPSVDYGRGEQHRELDLAVAMWNMQWEAAQFRRWVFDEDELPAPIAKLADQGDINLMFVPRTRSRYFEHTPLFHLLPAATLKRHGLPMLRPGRWPFQMDTQQPDRHLPVDFESRLSRAWASTVWRHLFPTSPLSGFTASDPIRLLAHNLDFWIPAVTDVIQRELGTFSEVDKGIVAHPLQYTDGTMFEGAVRANPRMGGYVWLGEEDAADAVARTVEAADRHGRLRGILDAVRSNRVEEDFSEKWTHAREDFERKLYHKRSRIKVRFVELTDNIPVQGPETEVIGRTVTSDFLALLNERDREVVVLLSSGVTKLTEVAQIMGYSNHSAVSKRLDRIRRQAQQFFD
jgi:hypothetical protein